MILRKRNIFSIAVFFLLISTFFVNFAYTEEESQNSTTNEIEQLKRDMKTLEKAVYKTSQISNNSSIKSNNLNEDILTRHLLKLNEI